VIVAAVEVLWWQFAQAATAVNVIEYLERFCTEPFCNLHGLQLEQESEVMHVYTLLNCNLVQVAEWCSLFVHNPRSACADSVCRGQCLYTFLAA
jgi:hypothetical protein